MIVQITGDTGGLEPYDIFLCDPTNTGCFYISGLNSTNYDSLLNGWASYGSSLQNGLTADFGSSKYSPAAAASRTYLTGTKGWTITDGGPV